MKTLTAIAFFVGVPFALIQAVGPKAAPELRPAAWINPPPATSLEELRGQPVLVEFWATWCPPCRQTMPHLNQIHRSLGKQGLVILSLSDESRAKVEEFVRRNRLVFPIAAECASAQDYGVNSIPRGFLLDRKGRIVWKGHPMDPAWVQKAREMLGG